MKKQSFAIVVNGDLGEKSFLEKTLKKYTKIICVDGAANKMMGLSILPSVIIGDLDSIYESALSFYKKEKVLFLQYSPCKNETDTDLAIEYCKEQGAVEIDLIGALGSRADHTLASYYLLYKYLQKGLHLRIITPKNMIWLMEPGEWHIPCDQQRYLSFLAFNDNVQGLTLSGVKYPLENFELPLGYSRCISNEFTDDACIRFEKGILVAVTSVKD